MQHLERVNTLSELNTKVDAKGKVNDSTGLLIESESAQRLREAQNHMDLEIGIRLLFDQTILGDPSQSMDMK